MYCTAVQHVPNSDNMASNQECPMEFTNRHKCAFFFVWTRFFLFKRGSGLPKVLICVCWGDFMSCRFGHIDNAYVMPCHITLCYAVIVNAMLCYVTWPVILCRVSMIFHKPNWNIFIVAVNGFPRTCYEVKIAGGLNGYHTLDPEQDGFEPIGVFCNISSTPVTAVVHHNLEEWLHITGYEGRGSYEGQVGTVANVRHDNPDMTLNPRCEQHTALHFEWCKG